MSDKLSFSIQPIVHELNLILKECDSLGQLPAEVVVVRVQCSTLLNALQSFTTNVSEKEAINALRQYAKVVLDMTYIKENQLVEEEFPVHDGYERMQRILDMLKQPEQVVHQVLGPTACVIESLDAEMIECLYWRKGALCYMYCHTVWTNKSRVEKTKPQLIKCLEEGVAELQSMLAVRNPVASGDDVVSNSRETVKLLAQGIFSDTHVLALMYAGEMCYWHRQLIPSTNQSKSSKTTSNQSDASFNITQPSSQSNSSTGTTSNQSDAGKAQTISPSDVSTVKTSNQSETSTDVIGSHKDSACHIDQSETRNKTHSTASCSTQTSDIESDTFDSQALGMQFLQRYVEIVKGPLRATGWDYSKAEDMIKN
ncbi:uncharacterized protein [Amphiura filiformis]|uniref:uncharacterized protein n=1 Tax=Amphiura filiformis TaxID=82378 RepID=UPI003B2274E4